MKKQKISIKVPYYLDWTYGVSIEKIRNDLDELEKLGANQIEIRVEDDWGSSYLIMQPHIVREETDDEFNKRLNKIKEDEEKTKIRELKELKRLKLKWEK